MKRERLRGRGGWHTRTQSSRARRTCHARGGRRGDTCGALVVHLRNVYLQEKRGAAEGSSIIRI